MENVETLYNTKIIQAGTRLTIVKYDGMLRQGGNSHNRTGRRGKKEISKEEKAENRKANRKSTLNKARDNIIKLVSANEDMQTFITLTYKENFQDLTKSKAHLKTFFKKLKKDYPSLKYLYVLEFQQRGAIHYHILTNINTKIKGTKRYKKSEIHKHFEVEFSKKYWKYGFVDIQLLKSDGIRKVGNYIASYLVEDLFDLDLEGSRCYGKSRNLNKPITTKLLTDIKPNALIADNENEIELLHQATYERCYVAKNGKEYRSKVRLYEYDLK